MATSSLSTELLDQASASSAAPRAQEAGPAGARPSKRSWGRRAWFGITKVVRDYFFGVGGERSDRNLVEVVRRDPGTAAGLLESMALFSALGNLLVGIGCGVFLSLYWSRCGDCDRPLRWWLLVQSVLQLSQLPVRLVLLLSVRNVQTAGGSIESCIMSLTASPAWRTSKSVALVQYGWFVLGLVWYMCNETCPSCPGINMMTISVMLLAALRALAAVLIFRSLFTTGLDPAGEAPKPVVAATPTQIAAIPCVRFCGGEPGACCSICLCEFDNGCMMRRLPCGHDFHRRCVDKWLQRNKNCPLCIQAVDAAPGAEKRDG